MDPAQRLSFRPPATSTTVLRTEPRVYQYCAWQNVSVGVWVGQATANAVRGLLDVGAEMKRLYPLGHSSIVFILDKLPAPDPQAREMLSRIFSAQSQLLCTAVILEGSGFWASGIRAMIGNTHRAASGSVRLGIGTSVDEVLGWFPAEHASTTGVGIDAEQLRAALLRIREGAAAGALNA